MNWKEGKIIVSVEDWLLAKIQMVVSKYIMGCWRFVVGNKPEDQEPEK